MFIIKATAVSDGIVFGTVYKKIAKDKKQTIIAIDSPMSEVERYNNATRKALEHIEKLYHEAVEKVGLDSAFIFDVHKEMLLDVLFVKSVTDTILSEHANCEYAVYRACEEYKKILLDSGNEYMMSRCADVDDVCGYLMNVLTNSTTQSQYKEDEVILAIEELAPSQVISLISKNVIAIIEKRGSSQSHAAILTRALGIPSVCSTQDDYDRIKDGDSVIVDGINGYIYVNYDEATKEKFTIRRQEYLAEKEMTNKLSNVEIKTKNGKQIRLNANVSGLLEVKTLIALINERDKLKEKVGIGLFRTEFIYMGSKDFPTEEYQYTIYSQTLKGMGNNRVVIRTLDVGGDKSLGYWKGEHEENPALGLRGVRFGLEHPKIFKVQLRALYRASVYGNLSILIPMISTIDELIAVKALIGQVKAELSSEQIAYKDTTKVGVMIETPAAALISDILAQHCDFFSIGTNDLTQYTLAVDRLGSYGMAKRETMSFYHTAVMRLVKMTLENASKWGIDCSVCGEAASELPALIACISMGIDNFSVPVNQILPVIQKIVNKIY